MGQIPNRTALSMLIFSGMVYLLALTHGDAGSRLVILLVVELPVFLLVATLVSVLINALAAVGGGLLGGSTLIAALIAGTLGWTLAFPVLTGGAVDLNAQLQPAHAVALATAWLFGDNRQTA